MILFFEGDYKIDLLMDELLDVFPEWYTEDEVKLGIGIQDENTIWITVPEGSNWGRINGLVQSHNPNNPSKAEQLMESKANARASAMAKFKAMGLTDEEIEALW